MQPLTHHLASLTFGSLCSMVTSPTRGEVRCTLVFIASPLVGEVQQPIFNSNPE